FPTEHLHGSNQHEGGRNHEKCDVDMIEDVPPARPLAELLEPDHHAPLHHEMDRLEDGAVESDAEQRAARSPALANEESRGPGVEGLENERPAAVFGPRRRGARDVSPEPERAAAQIDVKRGEPDASRLALRIHPQLVAD